MRTVFEATENDIDEDLLSGDDLETTFDTLLEIGDDEDDIDEDPYEGDEITRGWDDGFFGDGEDLSDY